MITCLGLYELINIIATPQLCCCVEKGASTENIRYKIAKTKWPVPFGCIDSKHQFVFDVKYADTYWMQRSVHFCVFNLCKLVIWNLPDAYPNPTNEAIPPIIMGTVWCRIKILKKDKDVDEDSVSNGGTSPFAGYNVINWKYSPPPHVC